ncbi:SCO family protein [Natronosalvus vescus]|uniref:SCO family protein n=1 Tax=Natronosalvus vescus TaxID=2953881 RepID=UPI002090EBF9|nr:SCO family protein [Natronosalvus vescus]
MDRRTYLGGLTTAGLAGLAGCLGTLEETTSALGGEEPGRGNWGDGQTVLDPPTEDRGDPIHPIHGHEMPDFSLPDPLSGETISSSDFEGEKAYLMTFFFTSCPDGACPALLLRLRRAQADSIERGYDDDLSLLAMTFDPERDTADVLEEYGEQQGVDFEAGNWHFLRPENYEDGKALLEDEIGMLIDRVEDGDDHDGHDDDENDDHGDHDGHDGNDDHNSHTDDDHDHGEYTFTHINLILLVNEHGVVERSYPRGAMVDTSKVLEDVRAVTGN